MRSNPLATRPALRRMVILSLGLPVVTVAAVLAYTWPAARLHPRHLPIGVVTSGPEGRRLVGHLTAEQPGAFDVHRYPDVRAARTAIEHRDVYGALVVTPGHLETMTATAAGPAVADLLDGLGAKLADAATARASAEGGARVSFGVTDVVPLSATDPKGLALSSLLLPVTICSIVVGAALGLVLRIRPAGRQILMLTAVAALAGLGAYLVAQPFLGVLPHDAAGDWATLALTVLATSAATAGLIGLIGAAGLGVAAALLVLVGNPFSGATSAPELLPGAAHYLGQALPPGAGTSMLRSAAYFHGDGTAVHLGVLVAWIVVGFVALTIGNHTPTHSRRARV